jgi:hypothetical protein
MPALAATYPIIAPVALAIGTGAIRELREIVTTKIPLGSMKTAVPFNPPSPKLRPWFDRRAYSSTTR